MKLDNNNKRPEEKMDDFKPDHRPAKSATRYRRCPIIKTNADIVLTGVSARAEAMPGWNPAGNPVLLAPILMALTVIFIILSAAHIDLPLLSHSIVPFPELGSGGPHNNRPGSPNGLNGMIPLFSVEPDDSQAYMGMAYPTGTPRIGSGTVEKERPCSTKDTLASADISSHGDVETPPEFVWMKHPELPEGAEAAALEGKVLLHVLVDEKGVPIQVTVISEIPAGAGFARKAIEAARTAVFVPAVEQGKRVKCWVDLPIEFDENRLPN